MQGAQVDLTLMSWLDMNCVCGVGYDRLRENLRKFYKILVLYTTLFLGDVLHNMS